MARNDHFASQTLRLSALIVSGGSGSSNTALRVSIALPKQKRL